MNSGSDLVDDLSVVALLSDLVASLNQRVVFVVPTAVYMTVVLGYVVFMIAGGRYRVPTN